MNILYKDEHFVAVNKPAGMFVHKTQLAEPGAEFALQLLRNQMGCHVNPVHRLDRPTEGVLLFAFEKDCTRDLCEAFINHKVRKEYLAVVRGWTKDSDRIDYPLASLSTGKKQEAITDYWRLATVELPISVRPYENSRYSLLKLIPFTGRQHQLRRHLKHIFHPICGDTRYGDGHHNKSLREHFHLNRLLLLAQSITFDHPRTGNKIRIEAPIPYDVQELFKEFNWGVPDIETAE